MWNFRGFTVYNRLCHFEHTFFFIYHASVPNYSLEGVAGVYKQIM